MTTRRVVEVLDSTPNNETVAIRNLYEPIFVGLWEISKKVLSAYHTDLCHDALMLGNSKIGDKFLWGYRPSGTTLLRIDQHGVEKATANIAGLTNPLESWHLVTITKMRLNHADGYITWINAKDWSDLERVIKDNLPEK